MSFGPYNSTYRTLVCPFYEQREQASWDFLVCEVSKGWPAVHVTLPFLVYLFVGDFLTAWAAAGLGELFEITMLLLFREFVLFETTDLELETLAGSLVGDWLINGTLGVLTGFLLARLLRAPPWIPRWPDTHTPPPRAWWRAWVCTVAFLVAFVAVNFAVGWVVPAGCLAADPATCHNVGLLLATALHGALLALLFATHRSPWVWHGYTRRQQAVLVALAFAFECWVHLQNAQPWIPFWLGPLSGFLQVWVAAAVWLLPLLLVYLSRTCVPGCGLFWHCASSTCGCADDKDHYV